MEHASRELTMSVLIVLILVILVLFDPIVQTAVVSGGAAVVAATILPLTGFVVFRLFLILTVPFLRAFDSLRSNVFGTRRA